MDNRTRWALRPMLLLVVACGMHIARAAESGLGLDARRTFSIPAQPMASALLAFSAQADIQVMTASKEVHGRMARAVSGEYTVGRALQSLLAGTGMRFHVISDAAVSIELDDSGGFDEKKSVNSTSGHHASSVLGSVKTTYSLSAQITPHLNILEERK